MPAVPDDLNERVQARLADFMTESHFKQPQYAWMLGTIVPSWRERWERHQPYYPTTYGPNGDQYCHHCADDGGTPIRGEWPCPDALSVLREIGIEP